MGQLNDSSANAKKHTSYEEQIKLEMLYKLGYKASEIGEKSRK